MNTGMTNAGAGWQRILIGKRPIRTLVRVSILIGIGSALAGASRLVMTPGRIIGSSMEPTCHEGQIKWINRLAYLWNAPLRGDIVAIQGHTVRCLYLKRLIGLPGERVAITNGVVFINGAPLSEPYLFGPTDWNIPLTRIGADEYLVIGDNRAMLQCFHLFGTVKRHQIVGCLTRGKSR